jgi:hypothetical protein
MAMSEHDTHSATPTGIKKNSSGTPDKKNPRDIGSVGRAWVSYPPYILFFQKKRKEREKN